MKKSIATKIGVVGMLLVTMLASQVLLAQEKSFTWISIPGELPPQVKVADWFDSENAVLYESHALDLIHEIMGDCYLPDLKKTATCTSETQAKFPGANDYVIIHVLRWKDAATGSNAQAVDKQNWYVFHYGQNTKKLKTGATWPQDPTWDDAAYAKNNRIFGRRNVYLLYVHLNRGPNSLYRARYTMTAKKKTPAYLDHFVSLLQLYGVKTQAGAASKGETIPNVCDATNLDTYYVPADLTFVPTMLPQPTASSGSSSASLPPPSDTIPPAPTAPAQQTNGSPGSTSTVLPPQSSTVPLGATPPTQPSTGSTPSPAQPNTAQSNSIPSEVKLDAETFDNEGRYHIDFSVAVPIRKISEISYVSSSNSLVPSKVDKQTTFGVFDYYFKAVDIKNQGWSVYPHALAGVAIDSNPLKRVLIGGGYGPLLAHFYMGLVLDTQSLPNGAPCGKTPTPQQLASGGLHNRTCRGFSLGLNVSAGSIIDALKSKSSTATGSSTK